MPGWRRFLEEHQDDGFEILSVALDHEGPEAARPFAEAGGPDITTVVDDKGLLSAHYQFQVVPNGFLVDQDGVLQYAKYGFSVDDAHDKATVERFISTGEVDESPDPGAPYALDAETVEKIEAFLSDSREQRSSGENSAAAESMRLALRLDPKNLTIRKQIWALEHPEKFHPVIDFDWQAEQLKRETAEEIAAGWCGPDGCPIPNRTNGR